MALMECTQSRQTPFANAKLSETIRRQVLASATGRYNAALEERKAVAPGAYHEKNELTGRTRMAGRAPGRPTDGRTKVTEVIERRRVNEPLN